MKDQIEALHRLQVQDRRMVSLERKLAGIPTRFAEMERDLAKLESMLSAELERLGDSRTFRRDQERQLEDEQEQIRNGKSRISQVKTPRELAAAQRELDGTRRLADMRSKEMTRIDGAIAEAEARIRGLETGLVELRQQFAEERTRMQSDEKELQDQLAKTQGTRKKLTEKVERQLLARYERIRKRSSGIGFVGVRERRCLACKMAVAHQTYVSLRNAEIIIPCENCGRLLYWAGLFGDEVKAEPAPKAAPAPKKRVKPGDEPDELGGDEPAL
ncbi:zinc ribbon domain-containing protein [Nannocystaceae bacterium ST9]